jgi:hypothetical protein
VTYRRPVYEDRQVIRTERVLTGYEDVTLTPQRVCNSFGCWVEWRVVQDQVVGFYELESDNRGDFRRSAYYTLSSGSVGSRRGDQRVLAERGTYKNRTAMKVAGAFFTKY